MEAAGSGKGRHAGHRSVGLGLVYIVFGLAIAALGFVLFAVVLVFSIGMLISPKEKDAVALAMLFLFFFGPLAIVLLSIGSKQARLGSHCLRPEGAALEELDPREYAMSRGVHVYRSFLGMASPLVTALLAFTSLVFLALPIAAVLKNMEEDWILQLAITFTFFGVLAGGFAYLWAQGRKFGKSICRMRGRHPRIGGILEADVEVECTGLRAALPPLPDSDVGVKLQFVTGKGGVLWEKTAVVAREAIARPGDGTLRIPVSLAIPAEAGEHLGTFGSWRLRLHARYPGVDYASMFWPIMVMGPKDPEPPRAGTK